MTCNGRCITYCDDMVQQSTAESACVAWGGHLYTMHSAADDACAMSIIASNFAWIGYMQATGQSTPAVGWSWLDNNQTPYLDWYATSNEPNDTDGVENDDEQCAFMAVDGTWRDIQCTNSYHVMCAK